MTLDINAKHGETENIPKTVVIRAEEEPEPDDDTDLRPVDEPVDEEEEEGS